MKAIKRMQRDLKGLLLAPLINVEKKERDRRLEERLKRSEEKSSQSGMRQSAQ